jgi:hypothetical protein
VLTLRGHNKALVALVFGPDGTALLSIDMGRAVRAWDPATGKGSLKVAGRKSRVVAFAADGKTIATGGEAVVGTGMAPGALRTAVSGRQGTSSRGATRQR